MINKLKSSCHGCQNKKNDTICFNKLLLVGPPNVGKSTFFNRLTGNRQKTANVSGTTVSVQKGMFNYCKNKIEVVDLPGAYSLKPISPDEALTQDYLVNETLKNDQKSIVVCVISLTNLACSLYLFRQIQSLGLPTIAIITMADKLRNKSICSKEIENILSVPVVMTDARVFNEKDLFAKISNELFINIEDMSEKKALYSASSIEDKKIEIENFVKKSHDELFLWVLEKEKQIYLDDHNFASKTNKIDKLLLHKVFGLISFFIVMFFVFSLTSFLSAPLISLITDDLNNFVAQFINTSNIPLDSFLINGIWGGAVTVLGFLPPLSILFSILYILESSGYMARIAFIADRAMRLVGLNGKAVLPLLVSFGCNLPAYSATRILIDSRQRRKVALMIPFMTCNARLAVFLFLSYIFFPKYSALVVFGLYIISILFAIFAGFMIKIFTKGQGAQELIIDLPDYQLPKLTDMIKEVFIKLHGFLFDAGKIIIIVSMFIWLLQSIPVSGSNEKFAQIEDANNSLFTKVSDITSPLFAPIGFGDKHIAVSLITGFVAKEVLIESLEQSYETKDTKIISKKLDETFTQSSNNHRLPAIFSFFLFTLIYTPCFASVVESLRNFGRKFALFSICLNLSIAYISSLLLFHIGSLFL